MAVNNSNYISFAETYENLALCSYSQGKMSDAIQYLEDAINHQPGRTKSIYLRTELLIIDGQWRAAKASLEQYLRLATVGAETLLMSVKIEAGLGNVESAKEYAQMLMTMYPKSKSAERYIKSSLYKRLNELDSDMQNESSQTELRVPQDLSSLDQSAEIDDLSDIEEVPELEPTIEVEEIPEIEEVAEIEQSLDVGEGSDSDLLQESELQYETEERSESEEILELEEVVETEELPQDSEIFTIEDLDDGLSQSEAETSEDDDLLLNYEAEYDDNYEDTQTHHIVEKDQNLFRISKKYNIKMSRLIEWNELSDPTAIKAGMRILIVDPANLQESESNE
jgi:type IV pilus assembly protein PilF